MTSWRSVCWVYWPPGLKNVGSFFFFCIKTTRDSFRLMFEMNTVQDKLLLNFQQVNKKRIYLDAFIEELRAEGIETKVGEMQYKKLPLLKL